MRSALAVLLCFLNYSAHADTWLTVPLVSYHLDRSGDHCEVNPGLGIETDVTKDIRFHAGGYNNSNCRPSTYICGSYAAYNKGAWRAGSALCGFTGYHTEKKVDGETQREKQFLIAPLIVASYERKTWGLNILFVPPENLFKIFGRKVDDKNDEFKGVIGLVWKKPF